MLTGAAAVATTAPNGTTGNSLCVTILTRAPYVYLDCAQNRDKPAYIVNVLRVRRLKSVNVNNCNFVRTHVLVKRMHSRSMQNREVDFFGIAVSYIGECCVCLLFFFFSF